MSMNVSFRKCTSKAAVYFSFIEVRSYSFNGGFLEEYSVNLYRIRPEYLLRIKIPENKVFFIVSLAVYFIV